MKEVYDKELSVAFIFASGLLVQIINRWISRIHRADIVLFKIGDWEHDL